MEGLPGRTYLQVSPSLWEQLLGQLQAKSGVNKANISIYHSETGIQGISKIKDAHGVEAIRRTGASNCAVSLATSESTLSTAELRSAMMTPPMTLPANRAAAEARRMVLGNILMMVTQVENLECVVW